MRNAAHNSTSTAAHAARIRYDLFPELKTGSALDHRSPSAAYRQYFTRFDKNAPYKAHANKDLVNAALKTS
jgi:hypothetical protein